jgi:probable HAF family extracellular repeat protein
MHRGGTLCLLVALLGPAMASEAAEYQYATIAPPGAQGTVANGINNEGQIVGYYFTGSGDPRVVDHAFLLSGGVFTPLADPQGDSTTPASINDAGQIAGSYNVGLDQHAFVLNGGAYSTIDPPGRGPFASANGINNTGRVIGYYTDPQHRQHEFQYADGQFVSRDAPNSGNTVGFGINDAGEGVGEVDTQSGDSYGFLMVNGGFAPIRFPGAILTVARAINNQGDIVGTYVDTASATHGFLVHDGVFTTLDVPGARLTNPTGINDASQVVGWSETGTFPTGFLATPIPEPAMLVPVFVAVVLLVAWNRSPHLL